MKDTAVQCPFFKEKTKKTVVCEAAKITMPNEGACRELIKKYCSDIAGWRKCAIAHCLENYYFGKEE